VESANPAVTAELDSGDCENETMASLLVVDDEPNVLYSLKKGLENESLGVITAGTAEEGIRLVESHKPDAVILDVRLPDMSGLDAFDHIRQLDPRLPVIVVTAYATTEIAIDAMKRGAFEYLLKPVNFHQLQDVVNRAVDLSRLRHVPAVYDDDDDDANAAADRIVGRSAAMQEVYKAIGRIAPQDVTVLIQGESGTGKELVARALYHHSRRHEAAFLSINCAAIPESLLESELFGHERGAFTGADRRRIGKFEQVDGGTIFLDEIGDMSIAAQAEMLRLLQDGSFERVGSNETIKTDVRIIAATNQNLEAMVAAGKFRQDLYYRLNVFTIRLPALRERMEDVPVLAEYFISVFNRELGQQVHGISTEAMRLLQLHDWPGNIRELQSVIKYALVHAAGQVITPEALPPSRRTAAETCGELSATALDSGPFDVAQHVRELLKSGQTEIYRRVQTEIDRVIFREVLDFTHNNQVQASEILGISRTTLRTRLGTLALGLPYSPVAPEQDLAKP
jgi:two-component system nitrogen regulation response regulator GlnG